MKVKKYKISIECEDELKKISVGHLYLDERTALLIYFLVEALHEKQELTPRQKRVISFYA